MDELLTLIINLPIPAMTNSEWNILDDIFSSLPEKSTTEFAKKWNEILTEFKGSPIQSVSANNIPIYIEKWIKMANALIKIHRNLATLWRETFKEEIDADALLDLTVELLPANLYKLRLSLPNIDKASLLEGKNQIGASLTTLYTAVSAKLGQIEERKYLLEPGKYADKIKLVSSIVKQKAQIQALLSLCEKYQEYLESCIEKIIKENDPLAYMLYYKSNLRPAGRSVITELLQELEFEGSNLPCKEATLPIIKKYLLLQDFQFTLNRARYTPEEKLTEFNEKFSNFESYINSTNQTSFFLKPFNDIYGFFSSLNPSHEETFFSNIKQVVEQVKKELGEKTGRDITLSPT